MPRGRKSTYDPKVAEKICLMLMDGMSLREICRRDDMPSRSTVFKWILDNPDFHDRYARAREVQGEVIADETVEIADDARNDWMERNGADDEGYQQNGEHVQRSRLRVDTRKWMAGKLNPKKFGDRQQIDALVEHSGTVTHAFDPKTLTADQKDALARLLGEVGGDAEGGGE